MEKTTKCWSWLFKGLEIVSIAGKRSIKEAQPYKLYSMQISFSETATFLSNTKN